MQHSMPPLSALRAFEATARLGSVTAADELSVTHGAVSRQLKSLDDHFGVALFAEAGRGIVLTSHGERLQSGVGEAFSRLKDKSGAVLEAAMSSALHSGLPCSFPPAGESPRLDRLHRELPQLKLQVVVSESAAGNANGCQRHPGVCRNPPGAGIEVFELMEEQICAWKAAVGGPVRCDQARIAAFP